MISKSLALLILDISIHYSNYPNLPTLSHPGHQFNSIITGGTRHNAQGRFRCNLQVNRLMIKRKVIRGALLYIWQAWQKIWEGGLQYFVFYPPSCYSIGYDLPFLGLTHYNKHTSFQKNVITGCGGKTNLNPQLQLRGGSHFFYHFFSLGDCCPNDNIKPYNHFIRARRPVPCSELRAGMARLQFLLHSCSPGKDISIVSIITFLSILPLPSSKISPGINNSIIIAKISIIIQ